MIKKNIKYVDFNGNERNEDFYFNLSEAEVMELELSTTGGYGEMIQTVVNAQDMPTIVKVFKNLVLDSYGKKSADGKSFIKSDANKIEFSQTNAYSKLFMELATDAEKATAFINGILPNGVSKEKVQSNALSIVKDEAVE